jgi:chorismate synthase
MGKQTATELLKERIHTLEIRQADEGKALKEEVMATYERLKPVNLLKYAVRDFATSAELKYNLFETVATLVNGLITKKLLSSTQGSPVMKILATIIQLGITNVVSNHRDSIYQFLTRWIDKLFAPPTDTKEESETY